MPPRNRISLEQHERIVRAFEDVHEDYLAIAETIGVNRSTARGIVSHYVREGRIAERPRGGANHVRVDDAMRGCLDDIINENCLKLRNNFEILFPCIVCHYYRNV